VSESEKNNRPSDQPTLVITIDGPSGAGKGTLSQLLAQQLGFHFLDSGALYRLVAVAAQRQGVDINAESAVAEVAHALKVKFDTTGETVRVLLDGDDVTKVIRTETVSMNASIVAAYPTVRAALLARQRNFRQAPGLIADGRDMGTAVFPQADIKFFLTASAQARAQRRYKQLVEKGEGVDMAALIRDIEERDERDRTRKVSPLVPAADAYVIDSTVMTIDDVLNTMLKMIRQYCAV
jgi:cytidylate kinase